MNPLTMYTICRMLAVKSTAIRQVKMCLPQGEAYKPQNLQLAPV